MSTKWSRYTYQAVANILYAHRMECPEDDGATARIAQRFEALFAGDNGRFDRDRFEDAVYRDHRS